MKDEIAEKLNELEREISNEKGDFTLWALLQRAGAQDRWDLVVSATWIENNDEEGLKYLTKKVSSRLDEKEILYISRIIILDRGNPILSKLQEKVKAQHGEIKHKPVSMQDLNLSGLEISYASISTSSSPDIQVQKAD